MKDIRKRYLERRFANSRLKDLAPIDICEVSISKGQQNLIVVLYLEALAVVFVRGAKGPGALSLFWKRLKCTRAKIEVVGKDISQSYLIAITLHLLRAAMVSVHIDVIKRFKDQHSDFRRSLYRQARVQNKAALRSIHWLFLKNPEKLCAGRKEPDRLRPALELYPSLTCAYYMKEYLRQLWSQNTKQKVKFFFSDWSGRAWKSDIFVISNFAYTLMVHMTGITAYDNNSISICFIEGTNNKIKNDFMSSIKLIFQTITTIIGVTFYVCR